MGVGVGGEWRGEKKCWRETHKSERRASFSGARMTEPCCCACPCAQKEKSGGRREKKKGKKNTRRC